MGWKMRNGVLWRLASLLVCLTACVETAAAPPDPSCAVTRVVDGDTLHLTCGGTLHKVRLLGYDTPEIFHPHCAAEKQAGQHATDLMQALVASGPVTSVRFAGHEHGQTCSVEGLHRLDASGTGVT